MALQQMAREIGYERLQFKTFSLMHLIRFNRGAFPGAYNDMFNIILLSKESANRYAKGGGDTLHHFKGRICSAIFDLRKDGFGTTSGLRHLLQRQGIQEARMPDFRSNPDVGGVQSSITLGFGRGGRGF